MNVVIISGNLGRDPELSYTPQTQTACCRLSVAVARQKKNEQPDWVRVTVWGRQAETCNQYLTKGQEVKVVGSLRINKDKDGKEYAEVVANNVELGARNNHVAQPMQNAVNNMGMPQPVAQETTGTAFTYDEAPLPWEQ